GVGGFVDVVADAGLEVVALLEAAADRLVVAEVHVLAGDDLAARRPADAHPAVIHEVDVLAGDVGGGAPRAGGEQHGSGREGRRSPGSPAGRWAEVAIQGNQVCSDWYHIGT